jgi:hypothetical protein
VALRFVLLYRIYIIEYGIAAAIPVQFFEFEYFQRISTRRHEILVAAAIYIY